MNDTGAGPATSAQRDWTALAAQITRWGHELGFEAIGISDTELSAEEAHLMHWLSNGRHGTMDYMEQHGAARARPADLVPGTVRIITARMNYWPSASVDAGTVLADGTSAYIARYALGRDYHKVLRARLQRLVMRIRSAVGEFGYRVFTDSAPVLEVALAAKAGLGWRGKHTLLLTRDMGSYFFLGEIYTDLPLPLTDPQTDHCGTCTACIGACPTGAIVAPYELDARRCISYLTIELKGSIPEDLRALIGNRVYGCDDCQLACPWNRFAQASTEATSRPFVMASTARAWSNCSRGRKRNSTPGWKAARFAGSDTNAGRATWQLASVTPRGARKLSRHWNGALAIHRHSCANT